MRNSSRRGLEVSNTARNAKYGRERCSQLPRTLMDLRPLEAITLKGTVQRERLTKTTLIKALYL